MKKVLLRVGWKFKRNLKCKNKLYNQVPIKFPTARMVGCLTLGSKREEVVNAQSMKPACTECSKTHTGQCLVGQITVLVVERVSIR